VSLIQQVLEEVQGGMMSQVRQVQDRRRPVVGQEGGEKSLKEEEESGTERRKRQEGEGEKLWQDNMVGDVKILLCVFTGCY